MSDTRTEPRTRAEWAFDTSEESAVTVQVDKGWYVEVKEFDCRVSLRVVCDADSVEDGRQEASLTLHAADARLLAAALVRYADFLDMPIFEVSS